MEFDTNNSKEYKIAIIYNNADYIKELILFTSILLYSFLKKIFKRKKYVKVCISCLAS